MAFNTFMADIYRRLKPLGFNPSFVREVILPDWWDDQLASVPSNRALAEAAIAKHLKLSVAALSDTRRTLSLPQSVPFRLKSATRGTKPEAIRPAILIAQRVAELLCRHLPAPPFDRGTLSAAEVRSRILSDSANVTLESLLQFCWQCGIVVAHLDRLPVEPGFRKFDGLVLFVDQRPCILLAEKQDSPPQLAFHLAHELGHLLLSHVTPGSELLPDDNLERIVTDEVEDAADAFACEILTGHPEPKMDAVYGLTGQKLAKAATWLGERKGIDPGVVALVYGRNADRMGPATNALKALNLWTGARDIIRRHLAEHVPLNELSDSQAHFLEQLVRPGCEVA